MFIVLGVSIHSLLLANYAYLGPFLHSHFSLSLCARLDTSMSTRSVVHPSSSPCVGMEVCMCICALCQRVCVPCPIYSLFPFTLCFGLSHGSSSHLLCSSFHLLCSASHILCSVSHILCSVSHILCSASHLLCSSRPILSLLTLHLILPMTKGDNHAKPSPTPPPSSQDHPSLSQDPQVGQTYQVEVKGRQGK